MAQNMAVRRNTMLDGLGSFSIIWFGQIISMIGSGLTSFGLGVWAYQNTGSVTLFTLITVAGILPGIIISPLAGTLVDRWDRRRVLLGSDAISAAVTMVIALLFLYNQLAIWHIYVAVAIGSIVKAFQLPAYTAAITTMIPKQQYARASGMMQFGTAAAQIVAPLFAVGLLSVVQLHGIILIDFFTFLVAVGTLLLVQIPHIERPASATMKKRSLLHETREGLVYIAKQRGLLAMLLVITVINFALGIYQVLLTPLVLKFTSSAVLGTVVSIGGAGLLAGAMTLTIWSGPKQRVPGVLGFGVLFGLSLLLVGIQQSALTISIASFCMMFSLPFITGLSQAIWQIQTAPELQGRVFATRSMIARSCAPLAFIIAGPLADKVFEPLLMNNGALAGSVGEIIGVGAGRGIGLLFVVLGIMSLLATVSAYLYPPLRLVEQEITATSKHD